MGRKRVCRGLFWRFFVDLIRLTHSHYGVNSCVVLRQRIAPWIAFLAVRCIQYIVLCYTFCYIYIATQGPLEIRMGGLLRDQLCSFWAVSLWRNDVNLFTHKRVYVAAAFVEMLFL